jgi:hypothetical protein
MLSRRTKFLLLPLAAILLFCFVIGVFSSLNDPDLRTFVIDVFSSPAGLEFGTFEQAIAAMSPEDKDAMISVKSDVISETKKIVIKAGKKPENFRINEYADCVVKSVFFVTTSEGHVKQALIFGASPAERVAKFDANVDAAREACVDILR